MTITLDLPSQTYRWLAAEAARLGTSPEQYATDRLSIGVPGDEPADDGDGTLLDWLEPSIGTWDGPAEHLAEDAGRRFAAAMAAKLQPGGPT